MPLGLAAHLVGLATAVGATQTPFTLSSHDVSRYEGLYTSRAECVWRLQVEGRLERADRR